MNIQVKSHGEVKQDVFTSLAIRSFMRENAEIVQVPLSFTSSAYQFDFYTEVKKLPALVGVSEGTIRVVIDTFAKVLAALTGQGGKFTSEALKSADTDENRKTLVKAISSILSTLNYDASVVSQVVDGLLAAMGKSLVSTNSIGAFTSSVLSEEVLTEELRALTSHTLYSYEDILGVISAARDMYQNLCLSPTSESVYKQLDSAFSSNPILQRIGLIDSIFRKTLGPTFPATWVSVAPVLRGILASAETKYDDDIAGKPSGDEMRDAMVLPWVTYEDIPGLNSLYAKAKTIWRPAAKDIGLPDVFTRFMTSLQVVMNQKFSVVSPSDVAAMLTTQLSLNSAMPIVLPETLTKPEERTRALFMRLFNDTLARRVVKGDWGQLSGRFTSVMQAKATTRTESAYSPVLNDWFNYISVVFETFMQVSAWFRDLAQNTTVVYPDFTHPLLVEKERSLVNQVLKLVPERTDYAFDNPRSFNDPGLLMGYAAAPAAEGLNASLSTALISVDGSLEPPTLVWSDKVYNNLTYVVDMNSMIGHTFLVTEQEAGDVFDAPVDINRRLLMAPFSQKVAPLYAISFPVRSNVDNFPAIADSLRYLSAQALRDSGLYHFISPSCELLYTSSAEQMARELGLPLQIATVLFKKHKGVCFRHKAGMGKVIIFSPDLLRTYEFGPVPNSVYAPQFRSRYPFLCDSEQTLFTQEMIAPNKDGSSFTDHQISFTEILQNPQALKDLVTGVVKQAAIEFGVAQKNPDSKDPAVTEEAPSMPAAGKDAKPEDD